MRNDAICPNCDRPRPSFVIEKGKCDYCRAEYERAVHAIVTGLNRLSEGWESAAGDAVRAERNQRLARDQWTVLRGSPLSEECQAAFAQYFLLLNRLTVDYEKPADVIWPERPTLAYQGATDA